MARETGLRPDRIPLALYVHLPWCVRKCPYCDFNSHALRGELPVEGYLAALRRDLPGEAVRGAGRPVRSIFFGGGTPSLFPPEAVGRLLDAIDEAMPLADDCEITLEANPGTVERERFAGFRAAGVNRLSIGVQSFHDRQLERLGRIHDGNAARAAVTAAADAGFERFNVDLMVGLPEQTETQALRDVAIALELGARHVSHYQLTLEPGTAFAARPPERPPEDVIERMQDQAAEHFAGAGLRRYEVSAWAAPGQECRHNLNYWGFGDYLALGAGAHGKITDALGIQRYSKVHLPRLYQEVAGAPRGETVTAVPNSERPVEFMMNALRLTEGVPARWFEERTGVHPVEISGTVDAMVRQGWLAPEPDRYRPTPEGLLFLNDLVAGFLNEEVTP